MKKNYVRNLVGPFFCQKRQGGKKKLSGFTLIELLVVIAIIGLLATIVMVGLNSARVKARNTRRNSDIKQLQTAFNMVADATAGAFPSSGGNVNVCVSVSCYGGWSVYVANAAVDAALAPYIKKAEDPTASSRPTGGYLYNGAWNGGTGYDGVVFPAGAYLIYLLESVTVNSSVCGPGQIWSVATNIQCRLKLN